MPSLDQLKEQVAYLKHWLGIVMVSFGIILLSFGVVVLHLQIVRRIDQIGKL